MRKRMPIVRVGAIVEKAMQQLSVASKKRKTQTRLLEVRTTSRERLEMWVTPETQVRVIASAALMNLRVDQFITAGVNLLEACRNRTIVGLRERERKDGK